MVCIHLLTRYRIPTFYLSSAGIHCASRLRQKRIINYQYGGMPGVDSSQDKIVWRTLAPREVELTHVTTLQVLIIDMSDVERVAWVLDHIPALQHLDLEETWLIVTAMAICLAVQ